MFLFCYPGSSGPVFPMNLKLQVVEADRVSNPNSKIDTDAMAGGIEKDRYGAPVAYHVSRYHPGNQFSTGGQKWRRVPAFGAQTGLRNIIHLYNPTRPGQSRGVPDLAPVIEPLKQLGRYHRGRDHGSGDQRLFYCIHRDRGRFGGDRFRLCQHGSGGRP